MKFSEDYTIPKMIRDSAKKYPEIAAQNVRTKSGSFNPITYKELFESSLNFAASLLSLDVKREEPIGLIADNRYEWLQADLGLLSIGAIDVPRGCDATVNDLEVILSTTECRVVIVENSAQLKKLLSLKEKLPSLKILITLCPSDEISEDLIKEAKDKEIDVYHFDKLMEEGKKWRESNPQVVENELEKGKIEDTATIIFTSGTTGNPKGVMLSHKNFLTQLDEVIERIVVHPGDNVLNVLPVWHVFERECEYVILIQGGAVSYSKPIGPILLADFKTLNPVIIPAVPRIFEALYDGIWKKIRKTGGGVEILFNFFLKVALVYKRMLRKMLNRNASTHRYHPVFWWILCIIPVILLTPLHLLGNLLVFKNIKSMFGKNFRAGVSGGGAYPPAIDEFFWAIGVKVVEGYGLTETAPIISVRPISRPVFRTVGSALRGVNARIVDPVSGEVLGKCKEGVLQVKGDTVMKGYYKNPELTKKAFTEDGWLDTGDLAIMTYTNDLQIKGRIKDTIVLRGGENLEPVPIEMKLAESKYIKQAVLLGQDQKYLSALILIEQDEIKNYADESGVQYENFEALVESAEIKKLIESEIAELINFKNGFKMFERISKFKILTKPFEVGVELSAKQEVMRFKIGEIYKKEIAELYSEN